MKNNLKSSTTCTQNRSAPVTEVIRDESGTLERVALIDGELIEETEGMTGESKEEVKGLSKFCPSTFNLPRKGGEPLGKRALFRKTKGLLKKTVKLNSEAESL